MKKQIYTTSLLILAASGLILSLAGYDRGTNESKDASTKESTVIESTTEEVIEQDFTVSEIFPKLTVGENFSLTIVGNKNLVYQSSDETVVTASDGVLTAIAPGKAVVTVSNDTGTVYVHVKVLEAVATEGEEETVTEVITNSDGSTEVVQKPIAASNGQTTSNPAASSGSGKTGNTGTSSGSTTSTGSNFSGKSNTNTNTNAPAPTPSTEAPATETPAPSQPTVYYYNWDYIIPRANEIIKQHYPSVTIGTNPTYQTLTDMDGFTTSMPYTDEQRAQSLADCVIEDIIAHNHGSDDPNLTGNVGIVLNYIETPGTNPNTPNLRYIHLTYYY